jgi:D-alanyl-D-alanine carboxypeptidase
VVGAALERASGLPWEKLIQDRLFTPLGMRSCGFGAAGSPNLVDQPWGHQVSGGTVTPVAPGPAADNPPVYGPAGTVHCSLADWGAFLREHLRGARGQAGLVPAASYQKLHAAPAGADYAFGWGVTSRPGVGGMVLQHAGSNTLNYAVVLLAPLNDRILVAVTNQGNAAAADAALGPLIARYLGP